MAGSRCWFGFAGAGGLEKEVEKMLVFDVLLVKPVFFG